MKVEKSVCFWAMSLLVCFVFVAYLEPGSRCTPFTARPGCVWQRAHFTLDALVVQSYFVTVAFYALRAIFLKQ